MVGSRRDASTVGKVSQVSPSSTERLRRHLKAFVLHLRQNPLIRQLKSSLINIFNKNLKKLGPEAVINITVMSNLGGKLNI